MVKNNFYNISSFRRVLGLLLFLLAVMSMPVHAEKEKSDYRQSVILQAKFWQFQQASSLIDTMPEPVHPDSIPYTVNPSFGRRLLKAPATLFHTAVLPLKWSIIWINDTQVLEDLANFFLNDEQTAGFYPNFSVGGRTAFAAGVTYFNRNVFDRGHSLDFNTFYTNRANYKLGFNYKIPPDKNRQYQFDISGNLRKNDDQNIFLGGNSSAEDLEIDYRIEQYSTKVEAGYLIRQNALLSAGTGLNYTVINDVSTFTESGEPIRDFIDVERFGLNTAALFNTAISATLDLRNAGSQNKNANLVSTVTSSYDFKQTKARIYSGALLDAGIGYNRSLNDADFEFLNYYGDWQHFVPLPGLPANRRLAFRLRLEKRYPLGSAAVPFYEQSVLGDAENLRGYEQDRFRNLGSLLLTLEYRYPIWDTWDAVVFTDQGQVYREFSQLAFDRFNGAVGTGLRFMTASDFLFRIEIAFSKEGSQSLLEFSMNF